MPGQPRADRDRATAADELRQVGVYLGFAWASLLAGFAVCDSFEPLRRRALSAAGAVYLALTAVTFAVAFDRGTSTGPLERRLWLGQAAALFGLALAVAWAGRATRPRVGRTAGRRAGPVAPPEGCDVLAGIVGDPGLVLGYPVGDAGTLVDANGRGVELEDGQERTSLSATVGR